jgi:GNAT superfamily N-acetyltransferase
VIEPRLRSASIGDEPAIAELFAANDEDLTWPGIAGWPYLDFLIDHNRSLVAEVGGQVVGFAAAVEAGPITHLCDLFVEPGHHGRGVGTALLRAVMPAGGTRTTFSSADPRALPIYARSGMRPSWPLLYLHGPSDGIPSAVGTDVEPVDWDGFRDAYRELTGLVRSVLDAFQATLPGAMPLLVREAGRLAAVGVARDDRKGRGRVLDRLVVAAEATPDLALLAAVRATAAAGPVVVLVPGPNPALPALLEAGLRIVDRDTYCESEPGLIDPVRRIPNTGFL